MKRYTPKLLIKYILKEFLFCVFVFTCVFLSLIIVTLLIEQMVFFKDKNVEQIFLKSLILSLLQVPNGLINYSPFLILFSGILFFVRIIRNNEAMSISISGFSNNFIILIPAISSFFLGIILITSFTPISSQFSKIYETVKQKYSNNDNLIILSNTGVWLKETNDQITSIIRADKIESENFKKLFNITIYKFKNYNFEERIDAIEANILKKEWILRNAKIIRDEVSSERNIYNYKSSIDIDKIKTIFSNSSTMSIWDYSQNLKLIRERGYYGEEIIIMINKQLSLPFLLFFMVILSTIFTINAKREFNSFTYTFLGVLLGLVVYYMTDASIALGKTGRFPIILSVWLPVIIIMITSLYSLINNNK